MKITSLTREAKDYPKKLEQLHKPPAQLKILGNYKKLFGMPTVGIVGSRKASDYGRGITQKFAEELARKGVCIVSGLALGIDSIAHKASLKSPGKTIAILPSGLSNIYPASHRGLAKEIIVNEGILVSEYENDFIPRKESFIQRNRIIAALSDALLIPEAAEKSGSLHTANFALELGRPVFAVPGNISSPTSTGTNNLIKTGAFLTTEPQDIYEALGISAESPSQLDIYGDNQQETLLLQLLSQGITSGDDLLKQSGLEVQDFQQTLTMLEIKGRISALGNNHWQGK